MKNIFLAIFLPIVLFFVCGWIFSFFPKTKTGTVSKWVFAGIVVFFFWKNMMDQGPELIIPLVFTIVIILSLLFFTIFKKWYDNLIYRLVNKHIDKNLTKQQKLDEIDKVSRKEYLQNMKQWWEKEHGTELKESELELSQVDEFVNLQKVAYLWSEGRNLLQKGKLNEAINYAEEALELKPDHVPSFLVLGTALAYNKHFDEGLEILFKALKLEQQKQGVIPNALSRGYLLMTIAYIYKMQGNKSKALDYAEKTLSLIDGQEMEEEIEFKKNDPTISELKKEIRGQTLGIIKELKNDNR